ncbi:hypothetical protein BHE74_00047159 [Ensete ventricosum]|uniref:Uncharacterized protein n=1 Tax=Ensete ventricosum TaxID=4639 RepID=A0A444CXB1_ENSVE|nr:hypothetical protein B296_00025722 [Ensete ventricosum]RWV90547.1 hypothetical protein GW17_00047237 [Ensete ventricosum]RWW46890.1 hypothetical protein BHE74_00047159 [Ensete ventricosum]RZR97179.1 hypothetical protein BHM03_00026312 [Ensete ventricosum]
MVFPLSSGRLICLQMKFLQRFRNLFWVLILLEMEWKRNPGCPWLLYTVMHGCLL